MIDRTRAERQRRYRQRQKRGLRVVSVEVDDRSIELLIQTGLLSWREGLSNQSIAAAISHLVKSLAMGRKRSSF